jgi:hypothetical protein
MRYRLIVAGGAALLLGGCGYLCHGACRDGGERPHLRDDPVAACLTLDRVPPRVACGDPRKGRNFGQCLDLLGRRGYSC